VTLNDVLTIRGRALEKHDYEFLVGDDGLSHLVVVTNITFTPRGADPVFHYFCPCGHFNDKVLTLGQREIATNITCIACNVR
jgi:hypothetical protein